MSKRNSQLTNITLYNLKMKTEVHASEVIDALYSQYLYDSCEAGVMVDFCILLLSSALWMLQILKTDHKYFWTCMYNFQEASHCKSNNH